MGEFLDVVAGFEPEAAFDHGEVLAGAGEVGGAAKGASGAEADFVELDVLFEVEGGEGADPAVGVGAEEVGFVVAADGLDGRLGGGGFEEFGERHLEGLGDAAGDGEGGVGLVAFDLAEHGTADAGGGGELVEGPVAPFAEVTDTAAEVGADGIGWRLGRCLGRDRIGGCHISDIMEKSLAGRR